VLETIPNPGIGEQLMLGAQLLTRPLADNPALYYLLVRAYRFLTQKIGLAVGSSTGTELTTINMPPNYLKRMGKLQFRLWERGLMQLELKIKQRQEIAASYDHFFAASPIQPPYRPDYGEHAMLRYSIRVSAKQGMLMRAKNLHIPLGDWFVSPLHPITGDLRPWGYQQGQCPVAEHACREVINLFTDYPLSQQQLRQLFQVL
jgi:perosamine synthetase